MIFYYFYPFQMKMKYWCLTLELTEHKVSKSTNETFLTTLSIIQSIKYWIDVFEQK
jgi:hypothetical protein